MKKIVKLLLGALLITLTFSYPFLLDEFVWLCLFIIPLIIILKMIIFLIFGLKALFYLPILLLDVAWFFIIVKLNNYQNEGSGSQSNLGTIMYYVYSLFLFFYLLKYKSKTFYSSSKSKSH